MGSWIKESLSFDEQQRLLARLAEKVQVFRGLTAEELLNLLEGAEKCTFGIDETVVREGSSGAWMYVIIDGQVTVLKAAAGQRTALARLQPGDTFGEMSLLDQELRSASVVAETPCILLRLSEKTIEKVPATSAKIYRNIACILSRRLRDMDDAYVLCSSRHGRAK